MNKLRTHQEARAWLHEQGITITQWSEDHGFSHPLVREVLAGRKKGLRGQAHNIAIALGLKRGVPTDRPARVKRGGGAASAQAQGARA
ncbi:DNA-binding protein [Tibeticola sp.]|uniref:DNA-binding protein n=1 Tax=Tibeticola sp. TaxID=2005368 RepID=UPI0025E87E52|nr:DNA-binding protein [Tibeticola sp.]